MPVTAAIAAGPLFASNMKPELWIYINGIWTKPGDARGWTDRAVIWTHCHAWRMKPVPMVVADKFEYWSGALTRRVGQDKRAVGLRWMLNEYQSGNDWSINVMAHSNGADVVDRVTELLGGDTNIDRMHLVAPACESDFRKNGFGKHLASGAIGRLYVHWADNDRAMNWAKVSSKVGGIVSGLFPFVGELGYGYLGLEGPDLETLPEELRSRVIGRRYRGWGHSTFWEPEHFSAFLASAHSEP